MYIYMYAKQVEPLPPGLAACIGGGLSAGLQREVRYRYIDIDIDIDR